MEERPILALKAAPISQKQKITTEIVPNAKKKKCSKRKKLLEIREVGKKLPRYLWKALSTQLEQFWSYSTFQRRGGEGGGSKAPLGLNRDKQLKTIQ